MPTLLAASVDRRTRAAAQAKTGLFLLVSQPASPGPKKKTMGRVRGVFKMLVEGPREPSAGPPTGLDTEACKCVVRSKQDV